jgi:NADH-quinone oxidoreductase subunit G
LAHVTIDDRSFEVAEGRNLLEISLSLGLDLPYFCWHPALGSVGACRQCAVKQYESDDDDKGKIVMACMTPASDGARISIVDDEAQSFRQSVIEWLMLNHPHDCPICDEGGECHLQDMTVMAGHDVRRTRFPKRTFRNQELGPFIHHEMNRCIECYRCVRFYREHAGGEDLAAFAAHDHVYFGRVRDGALESEFSGNLVEVCPTGVFTDKTLKRHFVRKWDLEAAPSICGHCGLGCNVTLGERYGQLRRVRNRFHRSVNGYFLCDRGRFGYEFVDSERRRRRAWRRAGSGKREALGRAVALDELATVLSGNELVLGIGSTRASLESNHLLRRLVGDERFFTGVGQKEQHLLGRVLGALRRGAFASLHDIETSDAALVLGDDVTQFAPRAALALRQIHRNLAAELAAKHEIPPWNDAALREVAQDAKAPLIVATPFATRLDDAASEICRAAPPDLARLGFAVARALGDGNVQIPKLAREEEERADRIAAALSGAEAPVVVSGTSLGEEALIEAASRIVEALRARGVEAKLFLDVSEANSIGVTLLGGGSLDDALEKMKECPDATLVVLENDLYRRAPRSVVNELLDRARRVIVLDYLEHETSARADLFLPAGTIAESDGTFINNEGRAQRFFQVVSPDDEVQPSWRWLAAAMPGARGGTPLLDDVLKSLVEDHPDLAGVRRAAPSAEFRIHGQRIPREPHRFSGRTAMYANVEVHEPRPPADHDSALAFSMEGYRGHPPPALLPEVWAPGWNSVQALNHYQTEVGEALQGGEAGALVVTPKDSSPTNDAVRAPDRFRARADAICFWPVFEIFGSEELSALAPAVASRAPAPYVVLSTEDAERLTLTEGDEVEIHLAETTHRLFLRVMGSLAAGAGGLPRGFGSLQGIALPTWGRIGRLS